LARPTKARLWKKPNNDKKKKRQKEELEELESGEPRKEKK